MAKSMTAFAREESRDEQGELVWEIRSVNHRFLEVFVRLPEEFRSLEPVIRERIGKKLARGKLDCTLRYKPADASTVTLTINRSLAGQIIASANEVATLMPDAVAPSTLDILRWPGVMEPPAVDMGAVQQAALALFEQTLENLLESREREGQQLLKLIQARLHDMKPQVELARQRMPEVVDLLRERLQSRLEELPADLDSGRIEQEMAMMAQRLDIDEEMDRLNTHIAEVERVLKQDKPVGRRLDFLMQELNREANTLGSKSADTVTTGVSVELKVLIEQMREQIQNLE